MKRKIRTLSVNKLEAGMILVNEIQQNRKVLIAKDTVLTDSIISQLERAYILEKIEVYEELESNEAKSVRCMQNKFNEISLSLQQVFNNISKLQKTNIKEVRELSTQIQDEAKESNIIIKNVVFYGSKNDPIYRHDVNVAAISNLIGTWMGLEQNKLSLLTYAAVLHDIGKIRIDSKISKKLKPLTVTEQEIMQQHALLGYNIVKEIDFLDNSVSHAVLMHHERLDGSGYPLGIRGDAISEFAKIIAIADVFDSINSNRYYKKSRGPFEAIEIIKQESFSKLDYKYCDIFLKHLLNYYIGEHVLLNTNKICKIIQMDINDLERPLVFADNEFINLRENKDLYIQSLIL
ncbi:HD-GYP domain-containing protein [Clostridium uliginosum]|uniref:HDIG domain-containing protein n=1 Tax=Clostridium uliginosum TaxID=119641 RepID=A0A1I1NRR7_9CLOT|nr:HD-GYP domain-containing protein [Clostridium uliginosum]SFD00364.1 HDIG domain-containing protein [Clostridium uliginosum]